MESAFVQDIPCYTCTSCVQFPLVKPAVLVEDFLKHVNSTALLSPPLDPNAKNELTRRLIQRAMKDNIEPKFPLPSAEAIKQNPNTPVFSAAGGGTCWNLIEQRNECIPMYKCDHCCALYVLPTDVREAAKKVDLVGAARLTDKGVRDTCVRAMRNAYQGLQVWKAGKAEVYCFETFVVMVHWAAEYGEVKTPVKDSDIPVFDIAGNMEAD